MILYFLVLARSYSSQVKLLDHGPIIKMEPFGFTENGTFSFYVESSAIDHVGMFLVRKSALIDAFLSQGKLLSICTAMRFHISDINFTKKVEGNRFSWFGKIPRQGVYTPYLLNCNNDIADYLIEFTYKNEKSGLDFREETLISMHTLSLSLSILFFIITASRFFIRRQTNYYIVFILMSIRIMNLVLDVLQYLRLGEKIFYDKNKSVMIDSYIRISTALLIDLILISISSIFSGLGSLKERLPFVKSAIIVVQSALITLPILPLKILKDNIQVFFTVTFVSFISLILFLRDGLKEFNELSRLRMLNENSPELIGELDNAILYSIINSYCFGIALIYSVLIVIIGSSMSNIWKNFMFCRIIQFLTEQKFLMFERRPKDVENVFSSEIPIILESPLGSEMVLTSNI